MRTRHFQLLLVRVYFDKAVLRADLKARVIGLHTTLLHDPAIKNFSADIQRAERIPDQVSPHVSAVIVGGRSSQIGVVHRDIGVEGTAASLDAQKPPYKGFCETKYRFLCRLPTG